MTTLTPVSSALNPLASIIDPADLLDAVQGLLALASRFALHGQSQPAREALALCWPALHLASMEASDPARLALLNRAAIEAEAALDDAAAIPVLGWERAA